MQVLADAKQTAELVAELGRWVASCRGDRSDQFAVVGVRSRGDVIARRVAEQAGVERVGVLDITLYRDDLSEIAAQPVVRTTEIDFSLDGLDVVLIDDVLMSGRSVRAALSVLMDLGRPRRVWLAVLVDRGGEAKELPIAADFTGMTHVGAGRVSVRVTPTDDRDAIELEGGRA
ncbi:MAG: phosphoribosyltransferase family protein [Planctomycetota bacterium]